MRPTWSLLALGFLAVVAVGALGLQRQANAELRGEIALVREQNRDLARLRTEQERLRAAQVSPADLEALRSNHAAVARIRGEVEALRAEVETAERETGSTP